MDEQTAEEIKRHFNVVAEGLRSDIRLVIEGVGANTDRLDRVDLRLDRVEVRLDGIQTELGGVRTELRDLRTRIAPLITGV